MAAPPNLHLILQRVHFPDNLISKQTLIFCLIKLDFLDSHFLFE